MRIHINDNTFKCKVCNTPDSITSGMMNQTFNHNFNGMIFMMPEKTEQEFWMYNCLIPLDIIMIDGDTITKINHNCQPCDDEPCKRYCGEGGYILEVKGGTCKKLGIKKGDIVKFPL